jgi:hypothetical protein
VYSPCWLWAGDGDLAATVDRWLIDKPGGPVRLTVQPGTVVRNCRRSSRQRRLRPDHGMPVMVGFGQAGARKWPCCLGSPQQGEQRVRQIIAGGGENRYRPPCGRNITDPAGIYAEVAAKPHENAARIFNNIIEHGGNGFGYRTLESRRHGPLWCPLARGAG